MYRQKPVKQSNWIDPEHTPPVKHAIMVDRDLGHIFDYTQNVLDTPRAMFSHSATQTLVTAGTAYAIALNTCETKRFITHNTATNNSRVYIDTPGTYLLHYTACLESPIVNKHLNIWLSIDGTSIANSNTFTELPISGETLMNASYIQNFSTNQYFEFYALSDVDNFTIKATAAGAIAPASPSIRVTTNFISDK